MSDQDSLFKNTSIQRAKQFDNLCDEFETLCLAGNRPSIEAFLVRVDEAEKQPLLVELVAIEMHYRKRLGESIGLSEYQVRFPGLSIAPLDETVQHALNMNSPAPSVRAGKLKERSKPYELDSRNAFTPIEEPGTVIAGRYKLLEAIGEGGMGTVWVAEQSEPVRRKVALKLIKAGMDSKSVIARFEAERQALAVMDHPNIAKVLDGGLTESGRPYFVMEYVKGVPINEYCDAKRLSVPERLQLFAQVCQAVQHAHQKGIIHRDLKPSNILVAPYDDLPVPKVIDFGLAKAMHQSLTDRTLHTAHDVVLGTPLYMSPEQAQLNNIDVDTRSDIYSLGVVLYELLTGSTPLEKQRFKHAAWNEMQRVICEDEPPRPSMRLSSSETLPSLAAGRQIEPARLTKLVRGELDWIVMKALEKDRSRRYETANGFALDVQRYLAGEPVLAAPPSASYLIRKFAKKHRTALTTAAAIALLLVTSVAISTWQAVRATRAELAATERAEGERLAKLDAQAKQEEAERQKFRAEASEKVASERLALVEVEKQKAEEEKQIAKSVRDFLLKKLLGQADVQTQADTLIEGGEFATEAKENPTIRELLDRAAKKLTKETIEESFPNQPLVQAEILQTVGDTYCGIGESEIAIDLLRLSLDLRQEHVGIDHPDTLLSIGRLAVAYMRVGKIDLALPFAEATLNRRRATLGPDHPDTLESMNDLGVFYEYAGKREQASQLLKEALALMKLKLGPNHPKTASIMSNLGYVYTKLGRVDLALPLLEEGLKLQKATLGSDHPITLTSLRNLAYCYQAAGKLGLAQQLFELSLLETKAKLGADHPKTLASMSCLAACYSAIGKLDLAVSLNNETLKLRAAKLGPEHPHTLLTMNNLAALYWKAKQLDKSIPLFEEVLQRRDTRLGRQHPSTLVTVANLGVNYRDAGRLDEALPLLEESYQASKKSRTLDWVGDALLLGLIKAGRSDRAAELANELLAEARTSLPNDSQQLADKLSSLGDSLLKVKAFAEAESFLRECLAIREQLLPNDRATFNSQSLLGGALLGQQKFDEAEPLLLASYDGMKRFDKAIPKAKAISLPQALDRLIEFYTVTENADELKKWQAERVKYAQPASGL